MPTRIRLKRIGGKHDPHFRIVIADSRGRRDGRAIEEIGYYCPIGDPPTINVKAERALYWLGVGAKPSDTVRSLLKKAGVMEQVSPSGRPAEAAEEEAVEEEAAEEVSEDTEPAADEEVEP